MFCPQCVQFCLDCEYALPRGIDCKRKSTAAVFQKLFFSSVQAKRVFFSKRRRCAHKIMDEIEDVCVYAPCSSNLGSVFAWANTTQTRYALWKSREPCLECRDSFIVSFEMLFQMVYKHGKLLLFS